MAIERDTSQTQPEVNLGTLEHQLMDIDHRIEALKTQYNLFFARELKVPPEKEREQLERQVKTMASIGTRSPRINLLVQNTIAKFNLYNNMWQKRLSGLESGYGESVARKPAAPPPAARPAAAGGATARLQIDDDLSFDTFYDAYCETLKNAGVPPIPKEKLVPALKAKLQANTLKSAAVEMTVVEKKVNIKLKKI